jgi:hypothetical protein
MSTEAIRAAIKAIYRPGDVVEVRAFALDGTRRVGRYPVGWELVRTIEKLDQHSDVYYVLNPTGLPAVEASTGQSGTREADIPWRRHFLLDFDPVRTTKLASDSEYAKTLAIAIAARSWLLEEGWTDEVIMATSGNGVHLLVPVDMPNDDQSKNAIRTAQRTIADKFNSPEVEVECFPDAGRLVRAYGTLNKKGPQTETLKWRKSGILAT